MSTPDASETPDSTPSPGKPETVVPVRVYVQRGTDAELIRKLMRPGSRAVWLLVLVLLYFLIAALATHQLRYLSALWWGVIPVLLMLLIAFGGKPKTDPSESVDKRKATVPRPKTEALRRNWPHPDEW